MKILIALFLAIFVAGCASTAKQEDGHAHDHGKFTKHLTDSILLVADKGLFSVEMSIPDKKLKVGVNTFELDIHEDRDRDVSGAKITVTPWMPGMKQGMFAPLAAREKGNGTYIVENVVLAMGGHWKFRVHIKWGDTVDNVVFDFPNVGTAVKAAAHEYIRVASPAGHDVVIGSKNPLKELKPDVVNENGQTIKIFTLTVEDTGFELFPGQLMMGWGFNKQIPGPTIRVREGDRVRLILKNESSGEHTIHVHGQKKSVIMDGVPFLGQKPVKKGESYTYEFTVKNIGTSFYHCHVDSAHHMDMGMYGAFIVEPKKEKIEFDREYILILDEWPTKHVHVHEDDTEMKGHDQHGAVSLHEGVSPEHEHAGEKPSARDWYPETYKPHNVVYDGFSINGRSFPLTEPVVVKEGERVRIRFINAGYKSHFMHTHSHKFQVVARDGAYVDEPQKIDTVQIGPAQRVDIILFADNPGIWPFHCHRLDHVTNEHIYPGGMLTFIQYVE